MTVSNASLHNYDQVAALDIRLGDRVVIKRSGDVIPYVIGPVLGARSGDETPILPPELCPFCATKVVQPEGAIDWFCANPTCPERIMRTLEFFVSRGAMDIEGMGPQTITALIEAELIQDEADIFTLQAEPLLALEGFAEKKVDNLLGSIAAAKARPFAQVLTSLGIDGVGSTVAGLLTDNFASMADLLETAAQIRGVEDSFIQRTRPLLVDAAAGDPEVEKSLYRMGHPTTELAPRYLDAPELGPRLERLLRPLNLSAEAVAVVAEQLQSLISRIAALARYRWAGTHSRAEHRGLVH